MSRIALIVLVILLIGIAVGVFLVQRTQVFTPKAEDPTLNQQQIDNLPPAPDPQVQQVLPPTDDATAPASPLSYPMSQ